MAVVSHLFLFSEDKFQGQARLMRVTPAPVWNYLFPDSPFLFYTEFYAKTGFYLRYANFGRPFSSGTSTLPCTRGSA